MKISGRTIDVNHLSNCRKQTVQYLVNLKPWTLGFRKISQPSECILTLLKMFIETFWYQSKFWFTRVKSFFTLKSVHLFLHFTFWILSFYPQLSHSMWIKPTIDKKRASWDTLLTWDTSLTWATATAAIIKQLYGVVYKISAAMLTKLSYDYGVY